jgi:hypothetical protein
MTRPAYLLRCGILQEEVRTQLDKLEDFFCQPDILELLNMDGWQESRG